MIAVVEDRPAAGAAVDVAMLQQLVDRLTRVERTALVPAVQPMELRGFGELERWAERAARSGMVPRDYANKPDAIVIAVQMGSEVGLRPLQSLQNIACINGRPSIWGDAMLALCKTHPAYISTEETVSGEGDERTAVCTTIRRGEPPVVRTFSVRDAKTAKLWQKRGSNGQDTPWITAPDRMLAMRARGFALRDAYPDKLRGLISAEEASDYAVDASRGNQGHRGPTIDGTAEHTTEPTQAGTEARARRTWGMWLDGLQVDLDAALDAVAVEAVCGRDDVIAAQGSLTNGALTRFNSMVKAAIDRTAEPVTGPGETPHDPETGEIAGDEPPF